MTTQTTSRIADLIAELSAMGIPSPGDGTLGIVVRQALTDNPAVTAADVADIWYQATEDARADREDA